MSENTNPTDSSSNFFNTFVAIAIAVIALAGALITKVQSDASSLSSVASNEEQIYYYQAMGKQISGDANTNYEFGTIYQLWDEYNMLAVAAEKGNDPTTASSYRKLRDNLLGNSALLDSKYFDPKTGKIDLVAYKINLYGLDVSQLQEMQTAAANVSDAWSGKDSTYVLQLTLLAVAGFLLGLALMTKSNIARIVFAASGIPMVIVISIWAYLIWKQPVYDLRETGAIPYFTEGASLIEQKNWTGALDPLDRAIDLAGTSHPYGHAYLHRAQANAELGNFEAAVSDYQVAIDAGENDPNVIGSLVWSLFQMGRFSQAIEVGQAALEETPGNLWLQLRVGMALLANGDFETAKQQYQNVVKFASQQTADMRTLGDDPSEIWWQLNDASFQLKRLDQLLKSNNAVSPVKSAIKNKQMVIQAAEDFASLLSETSISLQYEIPKSEVKAIFSRPEFSITITSDQIYAYKVDTTFQYSGLEKGQLLAIKVSRNGIEDPSWTYTKLWDQASAGKFTLSLTPAYADVYVVPPGRYEVSIYVNGKLIQKSDFSVKSNDLSALSESDANFIFSDMLDTFNFFNMDIFADNGDSSESSVYFDPTQFYENEGEVNIDNLSNEEISQSNNNDTFVLCPNPGDPACANLDTTGGDTATGDTTSENAASSDTVNGDTTPNNADTTNGDTTSEDTGSTAGEDIIGGQ